MKITAEWDNGDTELLETGNIYLAFDVTDGEWIICSRVDDSILRIIEDDEWQKIVIEKDA